MDDSKTSQPATTHRVGVYICHCGGNISDVVDVAEVARQAGGIDQVVCSRTNMFMCSALGQKQVEDDIKAEKLDRVVIAACAPHLHETTFRRALKRAELNPYLYEHVNIREQVSWVHHRQKEATAKAEALVAGGVAKAKLLKPLEPITVEAKKRALIIGGGVAGLKAALDLAKRGLQVRLIEKQDNLGGFTRQLNHIYPQGIDGRTLVEDLVSRVNRTTGITVSTNTELKKVNGFVGNFSATLMQQGQEELLEAGVIIMATGFQPYRPAPGELGYGQWPQVATLPELMESGAALFDQGRMVWKGRPVKKIGVIHCVGSRQIPGVFNPPEGKACNEYCSRVCCTTALNWSTMVKDRDPQLQLFHVYQDIRTYGRGHEALYEKAARQGTLFFKVDGQSMPQVKNTATGVVLEVQDKLTFNELLELEVDLVVLVTGMEPASIDDLVDQLKLPRSSDGFLQEGHPKLKPVELPKPGLLLAGTAQAPMDIIEASSAASAAAVKASAILAKGFVELPPFVARVDHSRCQGHGLCVDHCGYEGAIVMEEKEVNGKKVKQAVINEAICKGCGACGAVCPERAISVDGWELDQYDAMVEAILAAP